MVLGCTWMVTDFSNDSTTRVCRVGPFSSMTVSRICDPHCMKDALRCMAYSVFCDRCLILRINASCASCPGKARDACGRQIWVRERVSVPGERGARE